MLSIPTCNNQTLISPPYVKPHYGQAIAQCIISEYLLKYFPYEDLKLYEIGAGNGSLAMDILNFIQDRHPEVYERTRYTIIEISSSLAERQRQALRSVHECVEVVHKSIFRWNKTEPAPCFVVMMEVIVSFCFQSTQVIILTAA